MPLCLLIVTNDYELMIHQLVIYIHFLKQIIIATPGRLLDHIENKTGFSARVMGLKMLILDEADHLLDLGFRKDLEKIVDCLPRQKQSLLFSSTLPKEVGIFLSIRLPEIYNENDLNPD